MIVLESMERAQAFCKAHQANEEALLVTLQEYVQDLWGECLAGRFDIAYYLQQMMPKLEAASFVVCHLVPPLKREAFLTALQVPALTLEQKKHLLVHSHLLIQEVLQESRWERVSEDEVQELIEILQKVDVKSTLECTRLVQQRLLHSVCPPHAPQESTNLGSPKKSELMQDQKCLAASFIQAVQKECLQRSSEMLLHYRCLWALMHGRGKKSPETFEKLEQKALQSGVLECVGSLKIYCSPPAQPILGTQRAVSKRGLKGSAYKSTPRVLLVQDHQFEEALQLVYEHLLDGKKIYALCVSDLAYAAMQMRLAALHIDRIQTCMEQKEKIAPALLHWQRCAIRAKTPCVQCKGNAPEEVLKCWVQIIAHCDALIVQQSVSPLLQQESRALIVQYLKSRARVIQMDQQFALEVPVGASLGQLCSALRQSSWSVGEQSDLKEFEKAVKI